MDRSLAMWRIYHKSQLMSAAVGGRETRSVNALDLKVALAQSWFVATQSPVDAVHESDSVLKSPAAWNAVIGLILFFVAHFALLVGVTTPEKF